MTPLQYFREILSTLPELARQTGYSRLYLLRRFTRLYLAHRIQIDEFRTLRLYDYTPRKVEQFLLWKRCKKCSDILTAGAAEADIALFNDKPKFNAAFAKFIRRDWLYIPAGSDEDILAFLAGHDRFLLKPCTGSQGRDISLHDRAATDPAAFLAEYRAKPFLMESFIRQHPALAAVNPGSVNTIRLITAQKGGRVQFIGAGLRCGGAEQFVDNFHHGGAAYPIDLELGIVTGPGRDLDGNPLLRHPTTGHIMPGLQIPFWSETKTMIQEAALMAGPVGYIGWDIAVTEAGPELVEGNVNYPGTFIIQLDGPGAWQRLRALMAGE